MRETHELEEALHHHFMNPALLVTALTHTSYANEAKHGVRHNERLEFLGDSVLSIVVAEYLFTHKNMPEGELTRMRASLVCEAALFEFAKQISLGDYLRLGRGEERGGGRCRPRLHGRRGLKFKMLCNIKHEPKRRRLHGRRGLK